MFRCFLPFCNKTYFPPTSCSESILDVETFTLFIETPPCFRRRRAAPFESTSPINARDSSSPSYSLRRLDEISVSWAIPARASNISSVRSSFPNRASAANFESFTAFSPWTSLVISSASCFWPSRFSGELSCSCTSSDISLTSNRVSCRRNRSRSLSSTRSQYWWN